MRSFLRSAWSMLFVAALLVGAVAVAAAQDEAEAVVSAATVVRTKPAAPAGQPLEELPEGDVVTILGRTANGNWVYVESGSGAKGWVQVSALTFDVDLDSVGVVRDGEVELAYPREPAVTLLAEATLADRPSRGVANALDTLVAGEEAAVLGRTANGNFYYIEAITGAKGWVAAASVEINVPANRIPVVRDVEVVASSASTAFTVVGDADLRDRPADTYMLVESLFSGRKGTLLGRTANGNYYYVEMDSGAKGWLSAGAVNSGGYPDSRLSVVRAVEVVYPPEPAVTAPEQVTVVSWPNELAGEPIDAIFPGETAAVLGKTRWGNYLLVSTVVGGVGWVKTDEVELNVEPAILPVVVEATVEVVAPPVTTAFTVVGDADLRDRPADTYMLVESLFSGRKGTLLGRTANGNYYYVEMDSGAKGWLSAGAVNSGGYPDSRLSVVRAVEVVYPPEPAVTAPEQVTVVSWPNELAGEPVDYLFVGETAAVLGKTRWGNYLLVTTPAGSVGWVKTDEVELNVEPAILPVVLEATVEVVIVPRGVVTAEGPVNMRTGPSTDNAVRTVVQPGEPVRLLGRNEAGSWLYVALSDGVEGWMAGFLIETNYDIMALEVF